MSIDLKRNIKNIAIKYAPFIGAALRLFFPNFNAHSYVSNYPDAANSKIDPILHYFYYGIKQGRRYEKRGVYKEGDETIDHDSEKDNIIIVSHEATRTGAPILCLNLIDSLIPKYNIFMILLRPGSLVNDFKKKGVVVIRSNMIGGDGSEILNKIEDVVTRREVKYALINSIESRSVLPLFAKYHIPNLMLVHEFASNTRPNDAFLSSMFWAGAMVFSTEITRDNARENCHGLLSQHQYLMPQGRCLLPKSNGVYSRNEAPNWLSKLNDGASKFIIVGIGTVHLRKGVDLFIQCAANILRSGIKKDVSFVWIGAGYAPDSDINYSIYLQDQIERSGLKDHLKIVEELDDLSEVYKFANLLLITSRLDPLPNVAIDALSESIPVLCFDKASGLATLLKEADLHEYCVSEYMDTVSLAAKAVLLIENETLYEKLSQRCAEYAEIKFNMGKYAFALDAIACNSSERMLQEKADVLEIFNSNLFNRSFAGYLGSSNLSRESVIKWYVRGWASGISKRKPFAGFHPGIYRREHGVASKYADPFADYLRAGKPNGPWDTPVIKSNKLKSFNITSSRVALHLHVFYMDLIPDVINRLNLNKTKPDLLISCGADSSIEEIQRLFSAYSGSVASIKSFPNLGRDLGPFLTGFASEIQKNYDYIGHVHTKKTVDIKDKAVGQAWYSFLLENLLGGEYAGAMMDQVLNHMENHLSCGMIFPDDPNVLGWALNKKNAEIICSKFNITDSILQDDFNFPVGSMFWARVPALKHFWDLNLQWNDYHIEPLPYDGTIGHALERLFAISLANTTYDFALTTVPGISR